MKRATIKFLHYFWKNADVIVLVIALAGWQFLTGTPLTSRIGLIVVGLSVVFRLLGAFEEIDSASKAPLEGAPPATEKREFVEDPEAVLELAKLTGYEAVRRFAPYLGKWMMISGRYEGIAESLQRDAIHLSLLLDDGRRMNLRFALEREEKLRALQEGQRITAICRIQYRGSFTPEDCELVRAERSRLASVA
jgi:hypothetical protein